MPFTTLSKYVSRPLVRYIVLSAFAALFLLLPRSATADINQFNQDALKWCADNIQPYNDAIALSKVRQVPTPTPPEFNPPCNQCGTTQSTPTVQAVLAWMLSSEKPEIDHANFLISVQHELDLATGMEGMSPAVEKCLGQFHKSDALEAVTKLAHRNVTKSLNSFGQYGRNPHMAYAGVSFILREAKAYDLTVEGPSQTKESLDDAMAWSKTVADAADKDVFQNLKYDLCPSYVFMYRQVTLLGGEVDAYKIQDELAKLQKFVHFKVTMDLHVTGAAGAGDNMDMAWRGIGHLTLMLDQQRGCYTPQVDGNTIAFEVQHWNFSTKDGNIQLVGPHTFNAPVKAVSLSLCDTNPRLDIVFGGYGPGETMQVKSQRIQGDMFGGMMATALAGNAALTGGHSASQADTLKSQLAPLQQQVAAHKGDVQWLMGPEGQAVIAKMESIAMGTAGTGSGYSPATAAPQKPGTAPIIAPIRPMALAQQTSDVGVNWTNGQPTVVDQTLSLKKGALNDALHVIVEHDPQ